MRRNYKKCLLRRWNIEYSSEFLGTIELYQGSASFTFCFNLIRNEMTREIQDKVRWCITFAHDIILVDQTMGCLSMKLDNWRKALKKQEFNN